ncbi:metal-sulfur cluster assembly factor [Aridibaculum aurantiacum]|uniref:metal-sulfur cluster assembly factor n=1 Tax=Aridibaculum aurantiacum TaxID=2810307 RepID=UPI001A95DB9F|nr:iron-sulfur cluster assembly protein [Aridibaculum aurantiacum]
MKAEIIEKIKTIYDPEIPVDIYNLGLIYEVEVRPNAEVFIIMTLTTATCPAAAYLPQEVETAVREVPGVKDVHVHVVYQPKWNNSMMSAEAREALAFS